jgi:hypothetical protein
MEKIPLSSGRHSREICQAVMSINPFGDLAYYTKHPHKLNFFCHFGFDERINLEKSLTA